MPTTLTGANFAPSVNLREKSGNYLLGRLQSAARVVKMKKGSGKVYSFAILDTNAPVQVRLKDKSYADKEVVLGDTVDVFAPTVLAKALDRASIGDIIRMEYLGKKTTEDGTTFHNFNVEKYTEEEYNAISQNA